MSKHNRLFARSVSFLFSDSASEDEIIRAAITACPKMSEGLIKRLVKSSYDSSLSYGQLSVQRATSYLSAPQCFDFLSKMVAMATTLKAVQTHNLAYLRVLGMDLGIGRAETGRIFQHYGIYGRDDPLHGQPNRGQTGRKLATKTPSSGNSGFKAKTLNAARARALTVSRGPEGMGLGQCYYVLGLKSGASKSDIRKAYHRLAKKYHPDKYAIARLSPSGRQAVERRMARINEAYATLKSA